MAEPRYSASEARNYLREATEDVAVLQGVDARDALILARAKAGEVERLAGVRTRIFLSRIGFHQAAEQPQPPWSEVVAAADRLRDSAFLDERQLDPVLRRLFFDRDVPDGSYRSEDVRSPRSDKRPWPYDGDTNASPEEPPTGAADGAEPPGSPRTGRIDDDQFGVPTQAMLVVSFLASSASLIAAATGTAVTDDGVVDWLFLLWAGVGLIAALMTGWAADSRRRYVSLLVGQGLKASRSDEFAELDPLIGELTRIGATREAYLLSSERRTKQQPRDHP